MEEMLSVGTYGATRQSYRSANPRSILEKIVREHRGSTESDLLKMFRTEVVDLPDQVDSIIEYWFVNNYARLLLALEKEGDQIAVKFRQQRQAQRTEAVNTAKEKIIAKVRVIMLDLVLPNGKTLRDTTGKECLALGPKVGKWLEAIGKKVPATATVGAALSEKDIQGLYSKAGVK